MRAKSEQSLSITKQEKINKRLTNNPLIFSYRLYLLLMELISYFHYLVLKTGKRRKTVLTGAATLRIYSFFIYSRLRYLKSNESLDKGRYGMAAVPMVRENAFMSGCVTICRLTVLSRLFNLLLRFLMGTDGNRL